MKFFKYGKHSLLYRGINGAVVGHLGCYLEKSQKPDSQPYCIKTKADIILNLFSFCYDCKYMIKNRLGLFFNCHCLGFYSEYDFLSDDDAFSFLNLNFGLTYVLLRKKNFLWNIYAGIGIMWGLSSLDSKFSYNVDEFVTERLKENFEKDLNDAGGLFKSGVWKNYFYCKQFKQNIKHFDIIFDCSAFDFTIKDHFRITLEWKGGIGNIYNIIRNLSFPLFHKLKIVGLVNLSINIGYVF